MNNITDADVKGFLAKQFGQGSKVDSMLNDNTLLIKTGGGSYQKVPRSAIENYARGNSERVMRDDADKLREEARDNVAKERGDTNQAPLDNREIIAAKYGI